MFDEKSDQLEELNKEFEKQWYNMDSEKLISWSYVHIVFETIYR